MAPILEARKLFKKYNDFVAVNQIDIVIPEGACYGLLGPNGAGKTTTVEMLEGINLPTSGEILYKGKPLSQEFRSEVGIQFQHTALQDFLTVRETLKLFAGLYTHPVSFDEIVKQCALDELLDRDNQKLSGGQRQRLLLALALINDPDLVFLDEPTTGLDPQARRNFWDLIQSIKAKGKTIVLTTHYMEEAAILCDHIAIMDRGEIIVRGKPHELIQQHFDDHVIELPYTTETALRLDDANIAYRRVFDSIEITTNTLNRQLNQLIQTGISLENCTIRQYNLEDLFIKLTGHALRE